MIVVETHGFESALSFATDALHSVATPDGRGIGVWIIAIIFAWSGIVKLRRPTLAAMAMVDFGVLRRVRRRLGSTLGAVELLLALLLATGALPVPSLAIAAGLLWLFVLLIAKSLWVGERFACFCFGDADSKLSPMTLARTAAFAILASVLVVTPPSPVVYGSNYALQAASAMALIGTAVLCSLIPKLLRWYKDLHGIANAEVNE